ncbi:LysR family transcriptional regulator ArgP [Duganella qianjiadongensis]|uniref:ArgP/LysG family DNA-binding transcriptional regulator n=1 Tax=Duganella qianjiadongensis TaxID=2692176 RepID=A0ABW9VJK1_9BURK|nr:LysR family transcriptional regulator ArgP [Duganella qianjiadongensis]MYM38724.1 ArgP/LysG family DNA-binding transcriptional regulator [Duganella qianjiadongensis]
MKQVDYRGLAALDAIIEYGNFDKAAAALAITQSAVSQRLRMLEHSAGELLIVRSQPPVPTAAGQRLIAHYRQVRLLEAALLQAAPGGAPTVEIAIAVNADSAATWLQEAITPLMLRGDCMLHIRMDDQDHTLSMLREGRVYGCVTSESAQVAGTSSTPLGRMRYLCVASPAYAQRWFPQGMTAQAVQTAPVLIFDRKDALQQRYIAQYTGYTGSFPHHAYASSDGFLRFVAAGFGYGMLPVLQCAAGLRDGTLIDLTPGHYLDVPLIWHRWDIDTPYTRQLSARIIATAQRWLLQEAAPH